MRSLKDLTLRRFWIEFEPRADTLPVGFGVTAIDLEDAIGLIKREGLLPDPCPPVTRIIEDVDVEAIRDSYYGLPWMAPPIWRGVWYPGFGEVMRKEQR